MRLIQWDVQKISELVNLWNSEIGSAFPMTEELFTQNSVEDENILPEGSFIAVDQQGQAAGFIVSKRWREKLPIQIDGETGWIQALIVRSSARGQGIGSALLEKAEDALRNSDCKRVFLGRDPYHYFPGVPVEFQEAKQWFERRGYHPTGVESDLIREFSPDEETPMPELAGLQVTLIKEDEKEQLLAFLHRCFPGRWEYEAYHYFRRGGTGREFVVLKKAEEIIGFCRINDPDSPVIAQNVYWAPLFDEHLGGIGPLGIDRAQRKNGYGLSIVEAAVSFLRERKIERIVIDWTGLTEFYGRLGFNVWKQYEQYYKNL
ncbi:GNAT family N-acetyltransferase [Bacillus sp. FJAT-29814]|uniref:GNAT family N-acetyltransferase n=1 Tax=Bacillus sp. FJAT-29814 TaxID=1729688 RepID=UPI00082A8C9E|nr:GNAT family N-acetyltransferase [Bacillus sp. FJAT-29814]